MPPFATAYVATASKPSSRLNQHLISSGVSIFHTERGKNNSTATGFPSTNLKRSHHKNPWHKGLTLMRPETDSNSSPPCRSRRSPKSQPARHIQPSGAPTKFLDSSPRSPSSMHQLIRPSASCVTNSIMLHPTDRFWRMPPL